jgi:sulfide:quinone oxidoreductase
MKRQVVILGAGFGGLELSTLLSERLGDEAGVTLIDQNDAFTFGFSKLDILFRHQTRGDVRLPYRRLVKRGVAFRQETIVSIDPQRRRVTTDETTYEADFLVVALGADYDLAATPGFLEGGFEYYSVDGAERLRDELPSFRGGKVLLAVLSIPLKCPPAPYEGILLLHDHLVERGIRDATEMHVVTLQPAPIPVSSEASAAVERTMAARDIEYTKLRRVYGIDPVDKLAHFKDHDEPYDLYHRHPGAQSPGRAGGNRADRERVGEGGPVHPRHCLPWCLRAR